MTTVFASEGAGLVSLLYDTSGLLAKKIPWLSFFFFSLLSSAVFSYLFPPCVANASVHADTW